jgi:hypothetical protein
MRHLLALVEILKGLLSPSIIAEQQAQARETALRFAKFRDV